jgi:transcriptional regulator with XRE-family HTH domain
MPLDEIGVERWQYDLWHQIIMAALDGHPDQVDLDYHPSLNQPAASRYGATTPKLLRWFKTYNQNRSYRDQVKPFNFLLAFQASPSLLDCDKGKPIAPYNSDIIQAARNCFDREHGGAISPDRLKTYREGLAQYHLSPESKFLNGDYLDRGSTIRRHVNATAVNHIGKEANHWEEQFYLGFDEDEQIEYGVAPEDSQRFLINLQAEIKAAGQREIARESGISRRTLSHLMKGKSVRRSIVTRIVGALRVHGR